MTRQTVTNHNNDEFLRARYEKGYQLERKPGAQPIIPQQVPPPSGETNIAPPHVATSIPSTASQAAASPSNGS